MIMNQKAKIKNLTCKNIALIACKISFAEGWSVAWKELCDWKKD